MNAAAAGNGWQSYRLRDVVTKLVDGSHNPPPKQDQGRPMLSARNVDQGRINFDEFRYISNESFDAENARTRVAPGDVLLTIVGTIGRSAVVPEATEPFALQRSVAVLSPKDDLLPKFLAYQFQSPQIQRYFEQHARGTAQKGVYLKTLGETPILVPPVTEQHAVVAEIEKQFSRLDEAVANLKRVTVSISRYRASVLSRAAGAAARWPTCRIADLLCEQIVNGLSVKESQAPTAVRALRLSAMSETGLDYADHRFLPLESTAVEDIVVREGDFFVSRGNGSLALVGRGATAQMPPFPVIFPDTMMRLRFADGDIRRWVAMLWPSRLVRLQIEQRVKTTAGIYKIAQPQVASICVPIPPISERERIVVEVERRLSIVRKVASETELSLQRASRLRQAALRNVFDRIGTAPLRSGSVATAKQR